MLIRKFLTGMLSVGLVATTMAYAQDYPRKPIRIISAGPGGDSDFMARLIAQGVSGPLGQPVIVDNRPIGVISGDLVSKSAPDGYTLLFTAGLLWVTPLLDKTPYDAVKDFSPISLVARGPTILVVHPSVPAKSVKELIALAKAKPGQLNYATTAIGTTSHLATELFKSMAGVTIVRVPYKSGNLIMNAMLIGEAQLWFASLTGVPHIKAGKLRALGVSSAEPSPLYPGEPTIAASGLPGYEFSGMNGIFAPARTPEAIVNRLNQEIVRFISQADIKQKFFDVGVETAGSSPEQFADIIQSDIRKLTKLIKDAGIKVD